MNLFRLIDPKKANYDKFSRAYAIIRGSITVFLSGLFGFTLLYNLGYSLNAIGNYMGQLRFNYFIGIRTPWTIPMKTFGNKPIARPVSYG